MIFGWTKPKFDSSQYGKITIDNVQEVTRKMIDDHERGEYWELLNCSLHVSWPFVRPPRYKIYTTHSAFLSGAMGGLNVLWFCAAIFGVFGQLSWQLYVALAVSIPYVYLYRKKLKLVIAKRFRDRILAQLPPA